MDVKDIINKYVNDEKLFEEIRRQITENNLGLDRLEQCNFRIVIDYNEATSANTIFASLLKRKVAAQHLLNVFRNNQYFNNMSDNIIVSGLTDAKELRDGVVGVPTAEIVTRSVLEYLVLFHILALRKDEMAANDEPMDSFLTNPTKIGLPNKRNNHPHSIILKKRVKMTVLSCQYCDTPLSAGDTHCLVCEARVEKDDSESDSCQTPNKKPSLTIEAYGSHPSVSEKHSSSINERMDCTVQTDKLTNNWTCCYCDDKNSNDNLQCATCRADKKIEKPQNNAVNVSDKCFSNDINNNINNILTHVDVFPTKIEDIKDLVVSNECMWSCRGCTSLNTDSEMNCRTCFTKKLEEETDLHLVAPIKVSDADMLSIERKESVSPDTNMSDYLSNFDCNIKKEDSRYQMIKEDGAQKFVTNINGQNSRQHNGGYQSMYLTDVQRPKPTDVTVAHSLPQTNFAGATYCAENKMKKKHNNALNVPDKGFSNDRNNNINNILTPVDVIPTKIGDIKELVVSNECMWSCRGCTSLNTDSEMNCRICFTKKLEEETDLHLVAPRKVSDANMLSIERKESVSYDTNMSGSSSSFDGDIKKEGFQYQMIKEDGAQKFVTNINGHDSRHHKSGHQSIYLTDEQRPKPTDVTAAHSLPQRNKAGATCRAENKMKKKHNNAVNIPDKGFSNDRNNNINNILTPVDVFPTKIGNIKDLVVSNECKWSCHVCTSLNTDSEMNCRVCFTEKLEEETDLHLVAPRKVSDTNMLSIERQARVSSHLRASSNTNIRSDSSFSDGNIKKNVSYNQMMKQDRAQNVLMNRNDQNSRQHNRGHRSMYLTNEHRPKTTDVTVAHTQPSKNKAGPQTITNTMEGSTIPRDRSSGSSVHKERGHRHNPQTNDKYTKTNNKENILNSEAVHPEYTPPFVKQSSTHPVYDKKEEPTTNMERPCQERIIKDVNHQPDLQSRDRIKSTNNYGSSSNTDSSLRPQNKDRNNAVGDNKQTNNEHSQQPHSSKSGAQRATKVSPSKPSKGHFKFLNLCSNPVFDDKCRLCSNEIRKKELDGLCQKCYNKCSQCTNGKKKDKYNGLCKKCYLKSPNKCTQCSEPMKDNLCGDQCQKCLNKCRRCSNKQRKKNNDGLCKKCSKECSQSR